jgi:hypothetical protein
MNGQAQHRRPGGACHEALIKSAASRFADNRQGGCQSSDALDPLGLQHFHLRWPFEQRSDFLLIVDIRRRFQESVRFLRAAVDLRNVRLSSQRNVCSCADTSACDHSLSGPRTV